MKWKNKTRAGCAASLLAFNTAMAASCSYTLSPGSTNASSLGGAGTFSVAAGNSCVWTAASTNLWIHPVGAGTGNGSTLYTVDPNLGSTPRTGAITAGGKTFMVNQAAAPMSLGTAVNNNNLVWITSSDYPWVGTNAPGAPAYDGVNSAATGNRYKHNTTSWLQTTVVGPGTLSFWWKVDSDATSLDPRWPEYDDLEFLIDGQSQDWIAGQVDWNYKTYIIPPGWHVLQWQYVKDAQYNWGMDQGWVDQVTYTTNTPVPLQEALNTCGVTWTSGGNSGSWAGQTSASHDAKSAAQSGQIYLSQETWMQATVSGVTNVSFWWSVSSQTNYDYLEFYTNNILARRISGTLGWQSNSFRLSAATNVLKWRYAKTNFNYVASGQDCGWVDQVAFGPNMKAFPYTLQSPSVQPDGSALVTVQGESGCNCQVLASSDLVNWAPVTNFVTSSGGSSTISDPGAAAAAMRFYRAVSQ